MTLKMACSCESLKNKQLETSSENQEPGEMNIFSGEDLSPDEYILASFNNRQRESSTYKYVSKILLSTRFGSEQSLV